MRQLVIATKNKDKVREIKTLLKGLPIKVIPITTFKDAPNVIEDGKTLEENAIKKAKEISAFTNGLALADDSGLEVESLDNRPGVYSSRFAGEGATYKDNNLKLLRLMEGLPLSKRKALFRCIIAIADKGKIIGVAEGRCRGKIAFRLQGKAGFGYDPVFIPSGYKTTFAQLGLKIKNKISHRSKALLKAKDIIKKYIES